MKWFKKPTDREWFIFCIGIASMSVMAWYMRHCNEITP